MSLKEAYTLAHTAQCRLNIEASRPDRNLRYVVGHLMHYESLRLRIVEIEHQTYQERRAQHANIDHTLQLKSSTPQPGPKSSLSTQTHLDDSSDSDEYDDIIDDDDAGDDLSLSRYPSGASRPQPPDLEPDDSEDDDYDDDFLIDYSPEEPDHDTLERAVKGQESELVATMYEGVRNCSCHGKSNAPSFERMWELPTDEAKSKPGVTRAVGQVSDREAMPQKACTAVADMRKGGVPITATA